MSAMGAGSVKTTRGLLYHVDRAFDLTPNRNRRVLAHLRPLEYPSVETFEKVALHPLTGPMTTTHDCRPKQQMSRKTGFWQE